jgi:hypothetical protein
LNELRASLILPLANIPYRLSELPFVGLNGPQSCPTVGDEKRQKLLDGYYFQFSDVDPSGSPVLLSLGMTQPIGFG